MLPYGSQVTDLRLFAVIAAGGVLGSLGRWGIGLAIAPWQGPGLPMSTLVVNITGCLAIGMLAGLPRLNQGRSWARPFLITGVLGGFTTFSALSAEVGVLLEAGVVGTALMYLLLTLVGGLVAVAVGQRLVRGSR